MNLKDKLIEVQKRLVAPKNQYSDFGGYSYRSAEDILNAVKPLNAEQGLLLTLTDEPIIVGSWNYIKATARITDGTDTIEVSAYAREQEMKKKMDSSQVTGATSSYARKYALNGLYLIDDTKDADTDDYQRLNNQQDTQQPEQKQPSKSTLLAKFKLSGKSEQEFNEWYGKQMGTGKDHIWMDRVLTKALADKK